VDRRLISSGAPLEPVVGYSRAVVAGGRVYVSGTAPIPADGSDPPAGSYEQARLCLEIIAVALERAGARTEDVVRTRIFVTPQADFEEVARAHGEAFGSIRPATAGIVVAALLDERWLVEIEADAMLPETLEAAGTLEPR
jgi:enamine deaminase RidA (YjgF/YER057c/UK114 family)